MRVPVLRIKTFILTGCLSHLYEDLCHGKKHLILCLTGDARQYDHVPSYNLVLEQFEANE